MKNKMMLIVIAIIMIGCNNESRTREIQIIRKINESIASQYKCKLTVTITNDQEKELEVFIQNDFPDESLRGKMFIDYCSRVKSSGLQFQRYILKDKNEVLAVVSQEYLDRLLEKIKKDEAILSKLEKDKSSLYNLLDDKVKNEISFQEFDNQLSDLDLKELKFCGMMYFDTLMSVSFENKFNRLSLIRNPNSDSERILGLQIQ